jgi:hypothetical protein
VCACHNKRSSGLRSTCSKAFPLILFNFFYHIYSLFTLFSMQFLQTVPDKYRGTQTVALWVMYLVFLYGTVQSPQSTGAVNITLMRLFVSEQM